MEKKPSKIGEHMFSIELKSKANLKNMILSNSEIDRVLIEGFLGELEFIDFIEGIMLELRGSKGSLRMDLSKQELDALLPKKTLSEHKKQLYEGRQK